MKNEKTANGSLDFTELIRTINNYQLRINIEIHKIKIMKDTLLVEYFTHVYDAGEELEGSDEMFKKVNVMKDRIDEFRKVSEKFDRLTHNIQVIGFYDSSGVNMGPMDILTSFK